MFNNAPQHIPLTPCSFFSLYVCREVFDKTLRYVDRLARDLSRDQIKDVRKALGGKSLHHFEVAQLINLDVESAEEAKFLIPSLNRISDEGEIVELLEEMKGVQDL